MPRSRSSYGTNKATKKKQHINTMVQYNKHLSFVLHISMWFLLTLYPIFNRRLRSFLCCWLLPINISPSCVEPLNPSMFYYFLLSFRLLRNLEDIKEIKTEFLERHFFWDIILWFSFHRIVQAIKSHLLSFITVTWRCEKKVASLLWKEWF